MTVVLNPNLSSQLDRAIALLASGLPIAVPSETVYGLAALAHNAEALARIFALKNRPTFDPLIVHVLSATDVPRLVARTNLIQQQLMQRFWPGPLTLLFEKSEQVPDLCTAGTPWVAIRSPAHEVFREILRRAKKPLAAPSANRFGRISPVDVQDVLDELGPHGLEAVVDGGRCDWGLESTVVKVDETQQRLEVVRLGAITLEQLRAALGQIPSAAHCKIHVRTSGSGVAETDAPGQTKSHYAPTKKLRLLKTAQELGQVSVSERARAALLLVYPIENHSLVPNALLDWRRTETLADNGNDRVAANRLFAALRKLDQDTEIDEIVALEVSETVAHAGLNPAITDRLLRATGSNRSEDPSR